MAAENSYQIPLFLVEIFHALGNASFVLWLLVIILWHLYKTKWVKYWEQRGENLATKKDIGDITTIIETIKIGNEKSLIELKNNHAFKFAEVERAKNIKKEVLLEASGALTRYLNTIGAMSNLNIEVQTITANNSVDTGILAKVQIVGAEKTVLEVTKITNSIAISLLDLMFGRHFLDNRKNEIHSLINLRNECLTEIQRYTSIMKEFNLQNIIDPMKWKTLNDNIEYQSKEYTTYQNNINKLNEIQNREHLIFSEKCLNKYFEILEEVPAVILAIREELDMPIDEDMYIKICNDNVELGRGVSKNFLNKASNLIEKV